MSRVHEALRRASQTGAIPQGPAAPPRSPADGGRWDRVTGDRPAAPLHREEPAADTRPFDPAMLETVAEIPFRPSPDVRLVPLNDLGDRPAEEFRTLRTRLNHLQRSQTLHTVVVTSASPAEGKTFTAVNLALTQAQLAGTRVLLADLDLRRPAVHEVLQIDRTPGASDYLRGDVPLEAALRRFEGTDLYVMPAGTPTNNPLELLNMKAARDLMAGLPRMFDWGVLDSPPLLFTADANLLSTMADGTLLVVRIGATSYDNVTRALQSLCENNVLGIVANGARAAELYSKYKYYYSKHE